MDVAIVQTALRMNSARAAHFADKKTASKTPVTSVQSDVGNLVVLIPGYKM